MTSLLPATLAIALVAQAMTAAKPDFSGTWMMDRERSESAMQEQPIGPVTVTVTQTGTNLTIQATRDGKPEVVTYTIEALPNGPGVIGAGTRRAYWDGMKLVTEGAGNVQGQTVSVREARTLNARGTEMTVETTVTVQHGYTFRGARNYSTAKDIYTRTAQ
ncbi:MAG: hypothetical protein Q7R30_09635 [Acidobacteriota bacterium]|nr:hypothetical protein [Acidobacteriota bacterium]